MNIGILSLQGCIEPHKAHIKRVGCTPVNVRTASDLNEVNGLILPGGESTTMLKLLKSSGLDKEISKFAVSRPVWGICAGAILIASRVTDPVQESLNLIDIHAVRNYYGSQLDSFEAKINVDGVGENLMAQFIRAPLLSPLKPSVKILSTLDNHPVCLRQGHVIACSFHTELGDDSRMHQYFVNICLGRESVTPLAA